MFFCLCLFFSWNGVRIIQRRRLRRRRWQATVRILRASPTIWGEWSRKSREGDTWRHFFFLYAIHNGAKPDIKSHAWFCWPTKWFVETFFVRIRHKTFIAVLASVPDTYYALKIDWTLRYKSNVLLMLKSKMQMKFSCMLKTTKCSFLHHLQEHKKRITTFWWLWLHCQTLLSPELSSTGCALA